MALAAFLEQYDHLVFDMDGVITSEQTYWNVAVLTAYELLHSRQYFGTETLSAESCVRQLSFLRGQFFYQDRVINRFKEYGVNSNWDLAYLTVCFFGSGLCKNGEELLRYLTEHPFSDVFALYDFAAEQFAAAMGLPVDFCRRNNGLWSLVNSVFQEWYLGRTQFEREFGRPPQMEGKLGLYRQEEPLHGREKTEHVLNVLLQNKKRLCIATGRPRFEIMEPFSLWGYLPYFDPTGIMTYTEIMEAEARFAEEGETVALTKPQPYIFLKALFGSRYTDKELLCGAYDKALLPRTLIIGDAGADILAAQAMGADFLAVLTGVSGQAARPYFEQQGATYILPGILEMLEK